MSLTHGYLVPGILAKGHLDEQDLNEQIREEAYTDAWETSLSKAQDMVEHPENKKMIANEELNECNKSRSFKDQMEMQKGYERVGLPPSVVF